MNRINKKVLEKNVLPIDFTGGIIIKQYNSAVNSNILLIFKKGEVIDYKRNLYGYYENGYLPDYIVSWLIANNYNEFTIYTDPNNIVNDLDFMHLIGSPYKLTESMDFIKKK